MRSIFRVSTQPLPWHDVRQMPRLESGLQGSLSYNVRSYVCPRRLERPKGQVSELAVAYKASLLHGFMPSPASSSTKRSFRFIASRPLLHSLNPPEKQTASSTTHPESGLKPVPRRSSFFAMLTSKERLARTPRVQVPEY